MGEIQCGMSRSSEINGINEMSRSSGINGISNESAFKIETHLHTSEASACATSCGAEMVKAHVRAGYTGFIVTDHFLNGNTAIPSWHMWKERIRLFCKGYDNAVEEAKKYPFHVFLGWEYADNGIEFLTYGLGRDFLLEYPEMLSWPIEKYLETVRRHGGFVSQAHPFREAYYITSIRHYPTLVDAVEICNASHTNPRYDERAKAFAAQHGLLETAGSDTHSVYSLTGGGMEFEQEINSMDDFVREVKGRRYRICTTREGNVK